MRRAADAFVDRVPMFASASASNCEIHSATRSRSSDVATSKLPDDEGRASSDVSLYERCRMATFATSRDARVNCSCLLYTSDAADERSSVDLGGRRIIK